MQAEKLAKYLTELKNKTGLSFEAISEISDRPESTVKNLCAGKVEDPRIDTVSPIVYALGGSIDEMLNPGKSKDELKEVSVAALKEIYEHQITLMKEANDDHIKNIREHYERHISDLEKHYEKRLADKCEHIDTIMIDKKWFRLASVFSVVALLGVFFFIEFMTPGHGWFTFGR